VTTHVTNCELDRRKLPAILVDDVVDDVIHLASRAVPRSLVRVIGLEKKSSDVIGVQSGESVRLTTEPS
jgi:hypothetical protein